MRADVEATRTYLELKYRDQFRAAFGDFPDVVAERVAHPTPGLYRHCYRTVGAEYHWRDRWDWSDAEIRAHLARPEISPRFARTSRGPRSRCSWPCAAARWSAGTSCAEWRRMIRSRSPTSASRRE